ncbi:putative DNA modification/repair radical SAM protein [Sphingomonas suaedae]|uniref:Putative DNA modification/repair radical SAM protein n=1 Tax=Sphingomonas suaedae TaxID=2599297 RepID=A0A518RD59_9SPHN|nr:putative DNA modification/repair radical SAM protein [Sphingomonas suaedae]QDX25393.1 putative DNA modification/repair radical SAM protein [Sphingomonas suaedae]
MAKLSRLEKLEILADAAKYDASCASSGAQKRNSRDGAKGGIGSTTAIGICHSYAPDGRCISLLKILMTNMCMFECTYCINRSSSNVRRAAFTVDEVVDLTLDFYKRNYIEGLFLSSGIIRSPDYTMEQIVEVARRLREDHDFRGYIHLKTIPEGDPDLIAQAGRYADRLSINIEMPSDSGIRALAPEKDGARIRRTMHDLGIRIGDAKAERKTSRRAPIFAPAGQSTQMIVGADDSTDATVLQTSAQLYSSYGLRRVYYSAFSPIPDASRTLPAQPPPLMREHRLYQSDWLLRFYGFSVGEIAATMQDGRLALDMDPKLACAMQRRELFPVDVNRAPRESLLRVPGLGARVVDRLIAARRHQRLALADVGRLCQSLRKIRPFIVAADWRPTALLDRADLKQRIVPVPPPTQLSLFAS